MLVGCGNKNSIMLRAILMSLSVLAVGLPGTAAEFPMVDTPDYKGAIVPADAAANDKRLSGLYAGFWTPSLKEIAKAEVRIAAFLETSKEKYAPRQREKLKWFRRQYFGYTRGVEKCIFCNFLPGVKEAQDPFEGLRDSFVIVHDRGPDYWSIHYNSEQDACSKFHVDLGY